MKITGPNMDIYFSDLQAKWLDGYKSAPSYYEQFCETRASKGRETRYAWPDRIPNFRIWDNERQINNIVAQEYTIQNKLWELTTGVKRTDLADDIHDIFTGTTPSQLGKQARILPDLRAVALLQSGTTLTTFDGVPFFSGSHPIDTFNPSKGSQSNRFDSSTVGPTPVNPANMQAVLAAMGSLIGRDGNPLGFWPSLVMGPPARKFDMEQVFNMQFLTQALTVAGVASGVATTENALRGMCKVLVNEWLAGDPNTIYVFDLRDKDYKPMAWQTREPPEFTWLNKPNDYTVFMLDQYLFGGRMRGEAGYGLYYTAARVSNS